VSLLPALIPTTLTLPVKTLFGDKSKKTSKSNKKTVKKGREKKNQKEEQEEEIAELYEGQVLSIREIYCVVLFNQKYLGYSPLCTWNNVTTFTSRWKPGDHVLVQPLSCQGDMVIVDLREMEARFNVRYSLKELLQK